MNLPFRSGSQEINGCRVDRVLRASTKHAPNLYFDIEPWHWGTWAPDPSSGWEMALVFAYEEDPCLPEGPIPQWLLDLCITARDQFGCNWILLDPEGDVIPELPVYDN
jgi:hypothetical protein